ncbi:MAG: extracellular solute-binding protein, partial [Anaerolineaceae bacterium]|nr:extracellular solute-binding protein [Anaerolineaceae bacterium]
MNCPNCNHEISGLKKFCGHCGYPITADSTQTTPAVEEISKDAVTTPVLEGADVISEETQTKVMDEKFYEAGATLPAEDLSLPLLNTLQAQVVSAETAPAEHLQVKPVRRGIPGWVWALVGFGVVVIGIIAVIILINILGPKEAEVPVEEVAISAPEIDCMGRSGGEISLLGVWSGDEEARIIEIFAPLTEACGITLAYEGTRDIVSILTIRVQGGDSPDIAMMPSIDSLYEYQDSLVPMKNVGAHLENYDQSWLRLGMVSGEVYGVFVKSDIKSLVWYSPLDFDAAGYSVPTTWEEFVALADQIKADGSIPFSMGIESGPATGWSGTDFIQDILLRTQGAAFAFGLQNGNTSWTDPAVKEAWEIYGKWAMDPVYTLG